MSSHRQNETGRPGRVILKHARDAMLGEQQVEAQWRELNYLHKPDFAAALAEYDRFAAVLENAGAELVYLPADSGTGMDSMYPRDAAVVCDRGAILCAMGKPARQAEPAAIATTLAQLKIPIHGRISGQGQLEGGDLVWLGERVVAVGQGYRTNAEGIAQLKTLLQDLVDEFIVVPLPHWRGPQDVFHLMSMISPIDKDLAAVYSPLLPVPFRQRLSELGIGLVEVPSAEFATQACNMLALGQRSVLMPAGNPETQARLAEAGVTVHTYDGKEISIAGGGGPTCLTRPVERFC